MRGFLADQRSIHLGFVQRAAAVEPDFVYRPVGKAELILDQKLIVTTDEPQQQVISNPRQDRVGLDKAGPELHDVVGARPVARLDNLISTIAGVEQVAGVPAPAGQNIIAGVPADGRIQFGKGAKVDGVVTGRALPRARDDLGQVPGHPVGEHELLDPAIDVVVAEVGKHVADCQTVLAAADPDDQVLGADGEEDDVGRRNPGFEPDPVHGSAVDRLHVLDNVLTIAAGKDIGVALAVALGQVIALLPVDDIRTRTGFDPVIAAACEDVGAGSHRRDDDVVIPIRPGYGPRHGRNGLRGSVGEFQCPDNRIGVPRRVKQRQPIIAPSNFEDQVSVDIPLGKDVGRGNSITEEDRPEAVGRSVGTDPVLPVPAREQVDVLTLAIHDQVIAEAGAVDFVARRTEQQVVGIGPHRVDQIQQDVARPLGPVAKDQKLDRRIADNDGVVAVGKGQDQVIAISGHALDPHVLRLVPGKLKRIKALIVLDHILPVADGEQVGIVPPTGVGQVVAGPGIDGIGPVTTNNDVVAIGGLIFDHLPNEIAGGPDRPVGKLDRRDRPVAQRARNFDLVSGRRHLHDEVIGIGVGPPHGHVKGNHTGKKQRRVRGSGEHFDPVQLTTLADCHHGAIGHQDQVVPGAGIQRHADLEKAGVEDVLTATGGVFKNTRADILNGQDSPVLELEELDRIVAVAA